MPGLENYFDNFRKNIIGIDASFESPYGTKRLIYADWIASGRLYAPIEERISHMIGPYIGNTHSEASETGEMMTQAYHLSHSIIKKHVNAGENDVIITTGTGMTGALSKLQRIMGLKLPEQIKAYCAQSQDSKPFCQNLPDSHKPIVFLTHLEHHSNHTSWLETIADVVVLEPTPDLLVNPDTLRKELLKHANRPLKIGSFSACSNVSGYTPPYFELAEIMHEFGGIAFVDFAASAPYVDIDMHPSNTKAYLDAIFFSPHKFLGGPGSSGVLVFNKNLYHNTVPDQPGGGTVKWTNRWGKYSYISDIETREDGGTPGFLQSIRAAMAIKLKEEMGVEHIRQREKELLEIAFDELPRVKGLRILADNIRERLGVISFYIQGAHHNLVTKLLNDHFGIQVRGGCSCAGTYGHFLLDVDIKLSEAITQRIDQGDLSLKPGWIRLSLHPTMTNAELHYIIDALKQIADKIDQWKEDYVYSSKTNEFYHKSRGLQTEKLIESWFNL